MPSLISKTKSLMSNNSLRYFIPIGWRGSFDLGASVNFVFMPSPSTFKYADANFRYALMRNLSLNASTMFYREDIGDTTAISGSLGIEYLLRAVTIRFRNELRKEKGPTATTTRSSMFLQASRPF
jgi:hypothetical protein